MLYKVQARIQVIVRTDPAVFSDNTWYHVAVIQDGVLPVLYIDGSSPTQSTLVSTDTTAFLGDLTGLDVATIGALRYQNTTTLYFTGFIDEVKYYSNTALSSGQVAAIYNAATPQDHSPASDYYLHEGSGADWSGNNNLATLQSGAVPSSDVPVLTIPEWTLEHSLDFNGTDQYGVIPDHPDLSFGDGSTDSAFSVAAWIKMDDATRFRIAAKAQSTTVIEWFFTVSAADKLGFLLYDGADNVREGVFSNSTLTSYEGTWTHVAATYDGGGGSTASDGITLYLNGAVLASTTSDVTTGGTYTAMHNTAADVWIGAVEDPAVADRFSDGKIASGGIWGAELDADAIAFLATNPSHDLNVDSGDYDYSSNVVAAHAIETGFGPFIIDYSGNGHHATAPSGAAPTWTTDIPTYELINTYCMELDGSTQTIDADGVAADCSSHTGGTWQAWIAPDDATPNVGNTIISFGDDNANSFIELNLSGITQTLLKASCTSGGTQQWTLVTTDLGWSDTNWHHVAIVHNGTDAKLYVDGVDTGATYTVTTDKTVWNSDIAGLDKFTIGSLNKNGSDSLWFNGKIDEVAIQEDQLTAARLLAIATATPTADLSSDSPLTWLRMGDNDGGTGSTITDQGSGSNNGTLIGSPTFSTDVH